jgi:hypothetical protein
MGPSIVSRTAVQVLVGVLAVTGFALIRPGPAEGNEFMILACQADRAEFSTRAFEDFANRGMMWKRACDPEGPGLRGLVTSNVVRAGRVVRGSRSYFVMKAPPGTQFGHLIWSGQARRHDCRYALQLWAARPNGTSVAIKNVRANRSCPNPGKTQAAGWPSAHAYDIAGATQIIQRVLCVGTDQTPYCSTRHLNYIRTFKAAATVVDTSPPGITITRDTPLARGEWVRGRQPLNYGALDNVGVRGVRPVFGGVPRARSSRACNFALRVPCPSGPGSVVVDTEALREGTLGMTLEAEDAAGNAGWSAPVTVRVDNTAPGAVPIVVAGGEGWSNRNDFSVAWANPAESDRAPIAASRFRLCSLGETECSTDRRPGEISGLSHLSVLRPGEWQLRVWREDAAGNHEPSNASVPVTLRYDPQPPDLGFEEPSASDPTRMSVLVKDDVSGLDSGQIELSADGSHVWTAIPTLRVGSRLVARIDDAAFPVGRYFLRATARDRASNQNSTDRKLDGTPMTLTLPLRTPTFVRAGVVVRRKARHRGRRNVLESRARARLGKHLRVSGVVRTRGGTPLENAEVQVLSRSSTSPEHRVAALHTNSSGQFEYRTRASASTVLRLVYGGSGTTLPSQREVTLVVPAISSIATRPRHLRNGQAVTFGGVVRSLPVPSAGKLVELQVVLSGHWQTFRTTRTDTAGRWHVRYRFRRSCGVLRYRFRARLPAESGYPFESGHTRAVRVVVRGAPCR